MAELCLMASHGYPTGLLFNHDHGNKLFKDCQQFSPQSIPKQGITGSALFTLAPTQDQRFDRLNGMLEPRQWINPTDGQDAVPNTELISFDISNANPDEILRLSMPLSSERAQEDLIQLSSFVDAMKNQVIAQPFASLVYPSSKLESQQLLLDFVGDLARNSKLLIHSDGRVEFTGSGTEMKDLLSVVAEFYLGRSSVKVERHSSLVPHFNWLSTEEARSTIDASLKLEAAITTLPLKSPNKIKIKTPRKKSSKKLGQDRDLYKRNYFHACESLLSIMLDRRQQGKTAILSLKKAGPELPDLLNRFSAGIAGTGITVLFNVMVQLASRRVPFCSSKVLSTGLGFALVWLSWAVNKLGTSVVYLRSRNGGKSGLKEEKMVIERVDQSLKEIYFRAVTVMVMAVLRLA